MTAKNDQTPKPKPKPQNPKTPRIITLFELQYIIMSQNNRIEDETLEYFDSGRVPYLNIEARTWYRDSHGLFDYDSQHIIKNKMKLFLSCHLSKRDDDHVEISSSSYLRDSDIVSIAYLNGSYYMHNSKGYMWQVIKSFKRFGGKAKNHKLAMGDIMKLGRYIFEVKGISSKNSRSSLNQSLDNTEIDYKQPFKNERNSTLNVPRLQTMNTNIEYIGPDKETGVQMDDNRPSINISGSQTSKDNTWRIWLSDEFDSDNPMISPWKCSGTMKYIHLDCLKEWLDSKKSEKKGVYFSSYLWENVFCELWKENFTENVTTQYGVVNILGIETPKSGNYILLEALNSEEILKKNTKIVHIIDFKKLKELTVGRGHDNNVRITDISISRLHSKLYCKNNQIYIDDQGSKFGTLIAIK